VNYLGIDCGSVGIKAVLLDRDKNVLFTDYRRNRGLIEALQGIVFRLHDEQVARVGVTGSGRNFAAIVIGADVIETEILAHAIGTLSLYPQVNTILDIGGEDCKIMKIRNKTLVDFQMNQVCGAGTGSVLDAIATRMGIEIQNVSDIALSSKNKLDFPGKCGIFTQSSVVSRLNAGADKSDILMGVIRALVSNYIMLGKGIELKAPFTFQGAVALNEAVVTALEEELESEVIVPEYAPYMGAIGVAILAMNGEGTKFNRKINRELKTKSVIVRGCENQCELTIVRDNGRVVGWLGNRCDKCTPTTETPFASELQPLRPLV